MERDLRPGEHAVLGLLRSGAMHGYEMARVFAGEDLMPVCPIEQSSLYTHLRTLEGRGFVRWEETRVGSRPPRKVFALTPAGEAFIDRWLRQPVSRMREVRLDFLLKLYFLHRLDEAAERALLAGQVQACEQYLAGLPTQPATSAFAGIVLASKRSAAEATLGWLTSYARQLEGEVAG